MNACARGGAPIQRCIYMLRYIQTAVLAAVCLYVPLYAQDSAPVPAGATSPQVNSPPDPLPPMRTTRDKWNNFVHETASPLTLGAGAFNAVFSQATDTDPKYGKDGAAFAQRFGASVADITTQNFFGDFVVASALHEDPRYHRKGSDHGLLYRIGYSISRAVVIRKDDGGNTFNCDNFLGSAASAGFSDIYYPPASRTTGATLSHYWIDVADNGFVNLAPEFWPDFRDKLFRRHHRATKQAKSD